ncbi:MAG: SBBP repeat-containing protein [Candidatus Omnitrophota bacterium]
MPLYFIPNQGQTDQQVAYYIQGEDKSIFFTSEGVTFLLVEKKRAGINAGSPPAWSKSKMLREIKPSRVGMQSGKRWTVKLDFVGARKDVKPVAIETAGGVISYFKGKPEQWKTGIPLASKIMYRDLWPGIDLVYYGTTNRIKYEFIVHPGADPSMIKLAYRGVSQIKENSKGQLVIKMPFGSFYDDTPVAWQEISGKRTAVTMKYVVDDPNRNREKSDGAYTYRFSIGKYDKTQTLVLDPAIIVYCGFIGGTWDDSGDGIAVDSSGCSYVTGYTASVEGFPVKVGPDTTFNNGNSDAFVAKVSANGSALVYCGYIGGSGVEHGSDIAVDASGCAYIVGGTDSSEDTFPVKSGPGLTYKGGNSDAFVAKISGDGTKLIYCGYIGGFGGDYGFGIAVDSSGYAYVVGTTDSTEATFPVKGGPGLKYKDQEDCFVAKVNADGAGLVYCGYIGGYGGDNGEGIAVDSSGCAYVVGITYSSEIDSFPLEVGPDLTYNGNVDAFVAKVNADGTGLVYCGYLGGRDSDEGFGIAVDSSGCAYVTGDTCSSEASFPVKVGPDLSSNDENFAIGDAFVAKVKSDGSGLVYCGYIGGRYYDSGYAIAVDASGCVYVTGVTSSYEASFPVKSGPDLTYNGEWDAFVAKVKGDGSGLDYCGYLGGGASDGGYDIAVDRWGNAYVTGYTYSPDFPVKVGPDLSHNDEWDAFVAKISSPMTYIVNFVAGTGGTLIGELSQIIGKGTNCMPVTAVPNTDYYFVNWTGTGGFVTTTENPLTVKNVTANLTIRANFLPVKKLTIKSPNGGETFQVNRPCAISWISGGINKIKIELYNSGGPSRLIAGNVSADTGTYTWFIPSDVPLGNKYKIKLTCSDPGVTLTSSSNNPFTITAFKRSPGDFSNDGVTDIIWRYYKNRGYNCIWRLGTVCISRSRIDPRKYACAVEIKSNTNLNDQIVGTGDFNGDGKEDILWRNKTRGNNFVWLMNGTTYIKTAALTALTPLTWEIAGTGDFNGDGYVDILWRDTKTGANKVWAMKGTTRLKEIALKSEANKAWGIGGTGDFNSDGKVDIVWHHTRTGANRVWMMNGTTFVKSDPLPQRPSTNWEIVGIGDYDGNFKPDILWRNKVDGQVNAWIMDGTLKTNELTFPPVTDLAWRIGK